LVAQGLGPRVNAQKLKEFHGIKALQDREIVPSARRPPANDSHCVSGNKAQLLSRSTRKIICSGSRPDRNRVAVIRNEAAVVKEEVRSCRQAKLLPRLVQCSLLVGRIMRRLDQDEIPIGAIAVHIKLARRHAGQPVRLLRRTGRSARVKLRHPGGPGMTLSRRLRLSRPARLNNVRLRLGTCRRPACGRRRCNGSAEP